MAENAHLSQSISSSTAKSSIVTTKGSTSLFYVMWMGVVLMSDVTELPPGTLRSISSAPTVSTARSVWAKETSARTSRDRLPGEL